MVEPVMIGCLMIGYILGYVIFFICAERTGEVPLRSASLATLWPLTAFVVLGTWLRDTVKR